MNIDNIIMLTGRITADPELKTTQSGTSDCTFNIAVDRNYKGSDGNKITDFITCTAWKKTAEFVTQYFKKGSKIRVVGSLEIQQWKDQNGNNRTTPNVSIDQVGFGESKKEASSGFTQPNYNQNAAQPNYYQGTPNFEEITDDDELPF